MGPDKMCLMLADHIIAQGYDLDTSDRYRLAYDIQQWVEAHERADDEEVIDGTVL